MRATGRMNTEQVREFLRREFPQGTGEVEAVMPMGARLRLAVDHSHLRPGGTVSGPAMMALADSAMYTAILGEIGPVALAVTTNLNINFLRRPEPADIIADARLFKVGKRLAVGEVTIYSDGFDEPVAHVTCTYSIPPRD